MKINTLIEGFERSPKTKSGHGLSTGPLIGTAGFTLAEMLVSAGIFSVLIVWMVSAQIYGMRVYTLAATKLVATSDGRHAIDDLRDQIREASEVDIGNCSSDWSSFNYITNGAQQGNAVEIFPTTNSTPYVIVYLQTGGTNRLMLYNSTVGTVQRLANYVTNQVVFDAEDLWGNVQSNNVNNRVIRVTLQFSQWEYPIGYVGGTNFNSYNLYQLRTRITRRAVD